jgi:hypothetical protein
MNRDRESDSWHYPWQHTPTLRERVWDFLSSHVVLLVLGVIAVVALSIALSLGVNLVR